MANVFEKPEKFAATGLAVLLKELKGAGLFVHKFGKADFSGAKNDTVNIKRPPILRAYDAGFRSRNSRVISNIVQSSIEVKLTKFPSSEVALTPEEETLDEVDYVRDVQAPQVRAIVEDFDEDIAAALRNADYVYEVTFDPNAGESTDANALKSDPRRVARRAKKYLDDSKVPLAGRYWLVGSAVSERIAGIKGLLEVDKAGVPEALRDGVVGRLAGFIIIDWLSLGENESYFVHNTAVALATVAPVVPNGAKAGATIAAEGLAVTQLWDYDPADKSDHSTVHAFTGTGLVTDPEIGPDGNIVLVDGNVQFEFVRAVKVLFVPVGASDTGNGSDTYTSQVTGTPTGGYYTLTIDGETTPHIAYNASNTDVAAAINAIEGVSGAKVTGTGTKTIKLTERVTMTGSGAGLTGGSSPSVTVTAV